MSGAIPWSTVAGVAWGLYITALAIWTILQKRGPVATVSWILVLAALPLIGFLLYYFFGPQRLRRYRLRRLRSRAALASQEASAHEHEHPPPAFPPGWEALARLGAATSDAPLSTALSARLLEGGRAKFNALFADIQQARHHIHLEYYIFATDTIGTELRDLLVQKAEEGVTVRVLVDALGSMTTPRKFLAPVREAGGEVAFFHDTRIGRRLRPVINFRSHRKIVVIDGYIGYTGGINVTDHGHEDYSPQAFEDVHLRFTGGVVHWLQMVFLEDWLYSTEKRKPPVEQFQEVMPPCPVGEIEMQILHSGPNDERESIHRVNVAAIHGARSRVWLTTPYFVPSEAAMMALTSAAARGVDVRLVVPQRSDSRFVSAAARSYYDELQRAGVKIWEYRERMLHAKTLIIDDDIGMVGTANFDNRSFTLNFEVCAVLFDVDFVVELSAYVERLMQQADQVIAEQKPGRSLRAWARQLGQAGARLLSPLL